MSLPISPSPSLPVSKSRRKRGRPRKPKRDHSVTLTLTLPNAAFRAHLKRLTKAAGHKTPSAFIVAAHPPPPPSLTPPLPPPYCLRTAAYILERLFPKIRPLEYRSECTQEDWAAYLIAEIADHPTSNLQPLTPP